MDYQETVNCVMSFLKEKKVCSSSRKSHWECYAALGEYMQTTGKQFNEAARDAWFSVMKTRYPSNKCVFWEQYVFQLEEMASTGSISDRRLYQNKSAYEKLPFSIRTALDRYLSECGNQYTVRTLDITKIECSMFLLALSDNGIKKIEEIDFQSICRFVKANQRSKRNNKSAVCQYASRLLAYWSSVGLCDSNFIYLLDNQLYPHTYYAFELGGDDAPVTGTNGTINGVAYTVSYTGNGATISAANQTATVAITNSQSETGSLTVTKEIRVNGTKANQSGTFQVALYKVTTTTPEEGEGAATETETLVGSVQTITVTNGESTTAAFNDLEIGSTYRVYEVTVEGETTTKVGTQFGQYVVSYDNQTVTISRDAKDATSKVINNIETVTIEAEKNWPEGQTVPAGTSVTLTITATVTGTEENTTVAPAGVTINPESVKLDGETGAIPWKYSWTNLPKYDNNGKLIAYTVAETEYKIGTVYTATTFPSAEVTEDGRKFSFTNTMPTTERHDTKTWSDNENAKGHRPTSITFTLKATVGDAELDATQMATEGITTDSQAAAQNIAPVEGIWIAANWTNLPVYTKAGQLISYSVEEAAVEGYTQTDMSFNPENNTWMFTNTLNETTINIAKVKAGTSEVLSGAKFQLQKQMTTTDESGTTTSFVDEGDEITVNGSATLSNLTDGTYQLVETQAPAGYIMLSAPIVFTVANGTVTLADETYSLVTYSKDGDATVGTMNIGNTAGTELPSTGGPGTLAYTLGGFALMLLAGMIWISRKRKYDR